MSQCHILPSYLYLYKTNFFVSFLKWKQLNFIYNLSHSYKLPKAGVWPKFLNYGLKPSTTVRGMKSLLRLIFFICQFFLKVGLKFKCNSQRIKRKICCILCHQNARHFNIPRKFCPFPINPFPHMLRNNQFSNLYLYRLILPFWNIV